MSLQNLKNCFFLIHTGTYLLHRLYYICISTKRKKHEPTLKFLHKDKYCFIKKVYFGLSKETALIKNYSDTAYSLYTIQYIQNDNKWWVN